MPNVTANTDVTVIRCSYTCNKCYRTSSSAPNGQCDHPLQTGNTAVGDTHLAPHCKTKCWLTSKKPNSKLTCFAHVFVTTLSTQVPDSKNESIWRKSLKKYWGNEAPLLLSYFDPYWHVAKLKLTMHWWWPHKPWYMFSSALLIRTQRMKHMPQLCSYKPKSSTKSNMIHWSPARMSAYLVDRKGEEKNWWSSPVISGLPIFLVPGSQQCIPWKRKMCPALLARFCLNESKICNTQLFKLTIKKLSSKINGKKKTAIGTKLSSHLFSPKRGQGWKHPAFFFAKLFSLLVGVPTIFLNISVYVWLRVYVCLQCCFDLLTHAQPSISKIVYFFLEPEQEPQRRLLRSVVAPPRDMDWTLPRQQFLHQRKGRVQKFGGQSQYQPWTEMCWRHRWNLAHYFALLPVFRWLQRPWNPCGRTRVGARTISGTAWFKIFTSPCQLGEWLMIIILKIATGSS